MQRSSRASSGFDVFRSMELGYGVVRLVIQYCTSGCSQRATAQRAINHFLSLKKVGKNGGGQNITHLSFGTFGTKKTCFGLVFKMRADFSLSIVDFFPFIFPFSHFNCCHLGNVTKENYLAWFHDRSGWWPWCFDFQSEGNFENMTTLADLLGQAK